MPQRSIPYVALLGLMLVLVLSAALVARSPAAIATSDGVQDVVIVGGALALYAGLAAWGARPKRDAVTRRAFAAGTTVGLWLALFEWVNLLAEHSVASPATGAIRGIGAWGVLFFAFGAAGTMGANADARAHASLRGGLLASVWSGVIAAIGAVSGGLALAVFFMPLLVRILAPGTSELTDASVALVVRHTFEAARQHLLLMPVVAAIFGGGGALAWLGLQRITPAVARALMAVLPLLAVCGIIVLWWAGSLPRASRPPYVGVGLCVLGASMATAYAVVRCGRQARVARHLGD